MIFTGTEAEARERLGRMVASDVAPLLSAAELDDLLFDSRRADRYRASPDAHKAFTASTTYAVGATVTPATRNGHYYTVTTAGTSASTAPTFPTTSGGTVTSNNVVFTESGSESWSPTYDLDWAAAEGWETKAGKASNQSQYIQDSRGSASDYLYLNCKRQAEHYRSRISASLPMTSARRSYSSTGLLL